MTMTDEDIMLMRPHEIGLDSLVSVDIRSWFLKNFQVSIPVLKIMGNDTMAQLVQYAMENVPAELVPGLSGIREESSSDSSPGDSLENAGDNSSVTSLSSSEAREKKSSTTDNGVVDWDFESQIPADFDNIISVPNSAPAVPPKVILLTGATGLLGHHLLNHLVKNTPATKVICVAIRNLEQRLRDKQLPPPSASIVYYEGSLSAPLLGLSERDAAEIFSQVDAVIHNGADTSHLKYFRDIAPTNVGSTVTITRLCLPRMVPIHYISSAGVALFSNLERFPEKGISGPGSTSPPADGAHGYMSSKYVNERFLEAVHERFGLRVGIHRPSTIVRSGEDAEGAKAELDWVNALIHYAELVKAVPRLEYNHGSLDLVLTETCCNDIAGFVYGEDTGSVVYSHEVGDEIIPLDDLQQIGMKRGEKFQVLGMKAWCEKAIARGMHPAVAAVIEAMDAPGIPVYPRLLREVRAWA